MLPNREIKLRNFVNASADAHKQSVLRDHYVLEDRQGRRKSSKSQKSLGKKIRPFNRSDEESKRAESALSNQHVRLSEQRNDDLKS
jgi:hypothetical protein